MQPTDVASPPKRHTSSHRLERRLFHAGVFPTAHDLPRAATSPRSDHIIRTARANMQRSEVVDVGSTTGKVDDIRTVRAL